MTRLFTTLDWSVLSLYFLVTIGLGLALSRKSNTTEAYTAANRSMPGWVCGLSIFATFLSSISFLALPGKSFATNWTPMAFSLSLPLATWIAVKWFLPYYRASGEVSAYALLEKRFGPWARIYAASFYLLTQIARAGMVLYLMALPLSIILGVPIGSILIVAGLVVTAYSFVGGIVAVIWTDALQAIVLIAGALVCLGVIFFQLPEGAVSGLVDQGKFSLGNMDFSAISEQTFWLVLINGFFINLQNFGIDQSYVQRYVASASEGEARRSVWLGGLLYLPVSAVFFLIGSGLFAFYQNQPEGLSEVREVAASQMVIRDGVSPEDASFTNAVNDRAATLGEAAVADSVFPHFIGKNLPQGVTGLIIAAILAAGMSTVSTSLNSSATVLHSDFFLKFKKTKPGDKSSLNFLRGATLAIGVTGTGVSFLLLNISSALDAWWTLSSIFSGGILGLFLLGMFSKIGNVAAATAVTCGLLVIAWMVASSLPLWPDALRAVVNPFHSFFIIILGTLTILFVGMLLSSFFNKPAQTP